jgi:trans-AT polyketide synthase/acyltransferase/oxidoreductase domain-containing protein
LTTVSQIGAKLDASATCGGADATPLGSWLSGDTAPRADLRAISAAVHDVRRPVCLVRTDAGCALADGGTAILGDKAADPQALPIVGLATPCQPAHLGDPSVRAEHGLDYAYVTGAMANGIASVELVTAIGRAGMLGFFGAAGLSPTVVEQAIERIKGNLADHAGAAWGINLIHSPNDPQLEATLVDMYLSHGVHLIEASAYLRLTLPVVRYRVHGIRRDADGRIVTPNRIIAKVSRVEVATMFMSPPPPKMLEELVELGQITAAEAQLAEHIPVAQDLTAEADSGGHTDNRPALALLPTMLALRQQMQAEHQYETPLRVGAAGGIATPASAVAAFAMGAAYVMTGSVNQACVESGSSDAVRKMLAEARQADVIMAPAADMFEMGVKVQVLKRGTMFAMRAAKLYELYRAYDSIEDLPQAQRTMLEKTCFHADLDEIWRQTEQFFLQRDPAQVDKAQGDPKHKMALVFRWYLGQASRWANSGEPTRTVDYQVWCGPAMGAFNQWARGSVLENPEQRQAVTVALNILYGAAVLTRVNMLKSQGLVLPEEVVRAAPLDAAELEERFS